MADQIDRVACSTPAAPSDVWVRELLDDSDVGFWNWPDCGAEAMWWSASCFALLGYEPGAFEPSVARFFELMHPDDHEGQSAVLERIATTQGAHEDEYRLRTRGGAYRLFRAHYVVRKDPRTNRTSAFGRVRLVTREDELGAELEAQRGVAAALRATLSSTERALGVALEQLDVPALVVRPPDVTTVWTNESARRLLAPALSDPEAPSRDENGEDAPTSYADGGGLGARLPLTHVLAQGEVVQGEKVVIRGEDRDRVVLVSAVPVRGDGGEVEAAVVVFPEVTEVHEEVAAAEASERLLRTLLDTIATPVYWKDVRGVYRGCNRLFAEYLGRSIDEVVGATVYDVAPRDRAAVYEAADRTLLDSGGTQSYETSVVAADGERREVAFRKAVYRDDSGSVAGLVGVMLDVTAQRDVEKALRDSERRYRAFVANAPDMVLVYSPDGRIREANVKVEQLLGLGRDELLDRYMQEIDPDHDARVGRDSFWERLALKGFVVYETRFRRRDGSTLPVEVRAAPVELGDGLSVLAGVRDLAEREEAQQALVRSQSSFHSLVENNPDAVLVLNEDGSIRYANRAASQLFQKPIPELIGHAFGHPFAEGEYCEIEIPLEDGGSRHCELRTLWIDWEDERSQVISLRDQTERRRTAEALRRKETELIEAQKMEAIGRLAGGVAHDFNNLLTVILTLSEVVSSELREGDPMLDDVRSIADAGERARGLTAQLLAFSRRQKLQPVVLDPGKLVREIRTMIERVIGEDVELDVDVDEEAGNVRADGGQIEQVLLNLAVNARDAMPDGGRIVISVRRRSMSAEDLVPFEIEPGDFVEIAVSDNGHGMDEETRRQVFEPFFTTKEKGKGTGLGLSTVYGIVRQSEGHISVDSAPGAGTTFRVSLPLVSEATETRSTRDRAPAFGHETVLLVEDERMVRETTRRVLERSGYRVLVAANGGEALLLSEAHVGPIDLLLTDVVMPRMNGRALADRLKASRPEMSVLFMSGYTDDVIGKHGLLEPDVELLEKPFTGQVLAEAVRRVLDDTAGRRLRCPLDGLDG